MLLSVGPLTYSAEYNFERYTFLGIRVHIVPNKSHDFDVQLCVNWMKRCQIAYNKFLLFHNNF